MRKRDMPENLQRQRLETGALVVGYVMSHLDTSYLSGRNLTAWPQAFAEASEALGVAASSIRFLRDEFDPVHDNSRQGWYKRPMYPSRLRVIDELQELGNDALLELAHRILQRDDESTNDAIDSLAVANSVAHNVAERLLTGRRAEEFFLERSETIIGVHPD